MPDIFALALVRGSPRTRANQKKWGIFKCRFRGILLRHQQALRLAQESVADVERYDTLRTLRHAS